MAIACAVSSPAYAPVDLDYETYVEAIELVAQTFQRFSPEEYYVVALGRSMTPYMRVMDNFSPGVGVTIPLSNFYSRPEVHAEYDPPLTPEIEARLFKHFDRFLAGFPKDKNILLVDYAASGKSMVAVEEYLTKYLQDRNIAKKVEVQVFTADTALPAVTEAGKNFHKVSLKNYPVTNSRVELSWFDTDAEYREFMPPFDNVESLKPRPEYKALGEKYQKYFEADLKVPQIDMLCNLMGVKVYRAPRTPRPVAVGVPVGIQ